jgi:death-on-curing protein
MSQSAIIFLTLDEVLEIHFDQIQRHAGDPSIRDHGLLQSAINMPSAGFGGQYLHDFPHGMAAAYLFHLAANHPFVDGNKRTALASALTFLIVNGFELQASKDEVFDLVIGVATGKADKTEVATFSKQKIRAIA